MLLQLFNRGWDNGHVNAPLVQDRHVVNRKRAQRLMRSMELADMAPGPNTSKAHPEHKVYLLAGQAGCGFLK